MTHEEAVDRAGDLAVALMRLEDAHQSILCDEPVLITCDVDVRSLAERLGVAKEKVSRALELLRKA